MAEKKNRCRLASCRKIIKPEYLLCFDHRKWDLREIRDDRLKEKVVSVRTFYCNKCGTSALRSSCIFCGSKTEEIL